MDSSEKRSDLKQPENNASQPGQYNASDLKVLEGLEHVRTRPGMYIGSTNSRGLHHLVYEIVDNSVDEALAGYASKIEVEILPKNGIRITDDGRGIPVDIVPGEGKSGVEVVMTKLNAGGKFGGRGYSVSGGLHGVGISVVNALSTDMKVEVKRDGWLWEQTYVDHKPLEPLKKVERVQEGETGTCVTFYADPKIFRETTDYNFDIISQRLQQTAFLNPGLSITLEDERSEDRKVSFLYEGGLCDYVAHICDSLPATPLFPDVIALKSEDKGLGISLDIALAWTTKYGTILKTFANTIETVDGGTHEEGFKAAITTTLNRYARDKGLLKENDENLSGEDVREGMVSVVSVKLVNPQFEGQTKGKLGNSEAKTFVQKVVNDKFYTWLDAHPSEGKLVVVKAQEAYRARMAARKAREVSRKKSLLESATTPDKLKDCAYKNPDLCELFIVEGNSAGGSAVSGRDQKFQAILPLRGKILNTEKASMDKMVRSETIETLIASIGAGSGSTFDVTKARYHKVIVMTDADVDGAHISTLLLTLFFRYMRPLINAGYVYIAMPPLYRIRWSKGPDSFAFSDAQRDKRIKEGEGAGRKLRGENAIQRYKGLGEMDAQELWETTMDPATRLLKKVYMEDAQIADETFSMLMGEDVGPRREFIEAEAKNVKFIDA